MSFKVVGDMQKQTEMKKDLENSKVINEESGIMHLRVILDISRFGAPSSVVKVSDTGILHETWFSTRRNANARASGRVAANES